MLLEFWYSFTHALFAPLLLFLYLGFLIPILRVLFEIPKVLSQNLTNSLLVPIGRYGDEELAVYAATLQQASRGN